MKPRRVAAGLLGAAACLGLLARCAGVPSVPVPKGSRVVVRLYDPGDGIELALANESYPELADIYSKPRADANLKLAPDQLMGELLAALERAGLVTYGRRGPPGEAQGDRGFLFVDRDGQQTVFPEPSPDAAVEERRAFIQLKLVMSEYYQHVGGGQYVENPRGRALFEGQR